MPQNVQYNAGKSSTSAGRVKHRSDGFVGRDSIVLDEQPFALAALHLLSQSLTQAAVKRDGAFFTTLRVSCLNCQQIAP